MLYEEVEGLFADFKGHQRAFAVVAALTGEAVGAVQVTGMRDV